MLLANNRKNYAYNMFLVAITCRQRLDAFGSLYNTIAVKHSLHNYIAVKHNKIQ